MATDKRTKYREAQAQRGLVQANEWVPRDHREAFRRYAQALRDGMRTVPSDRDRPPRERLFWSAVRDVVAETIDGRLITVVMDEGELVVVYRLGADVKVKVLAAEEHRAAIAAEALDRLERSLGTKEG